MRSFFWLLFFIAYLLLGRWYFICQIKQQCVEEQEETDFRLNNLQFVDGETVVFRNRLDDDAKTALFRIAQEALTNIERHSEATEVRVRIFGHKKGATLRVQDNGKGFQPDSAKGGLGLRNMEERIEQLDGTLRILSSPSGTMIEAEVPLTHLLRPDTSAKESA